MMARHKMVLTILMVTLMAVSTSALAKPARGIPSPGEFSGRRVALVIGNDDYRHVQKLRNAVADARAMRGALEGLGFDVVYRENAGRRSMHNAIRQFVNKLSTDAVGLLFYAGHGVQIRGGGNYLIPVDLEAENEDHIAHDAIPLNDVLSRMSGTNARFSLAIVDACRNNPYKKSGSGRAIGHSRGLAAPSGNASGVMIIYSAGAGQEALDRLSPQDTDPNGLFTREFLKVMQRPGLKVQDVVSTVKLSVISQARSIGHTQTPAIYDQSVGTFSFVDKPTPPPPPPVIKTPPPVVKGMLPVTTGPSRSALELEFWTFIKDSGNRAMFEAYLAKYPNGEFVPLAKIALQGLITPPVTPVLTPPVTPVQPVPIHTARVIPAPAVPSRVAPPPVIQVPVPVESKKHRLTVRSNVYRDTVTIDGVVHGSTMVDVALSEGLHTVRVEKAGYAPYESQVTLRYDQTVRAVLKRLPPVGASVHRPTPSEGTTYVPDKSRVPDVPSSPISWTDSFTGMKFMKIPAGCYEMGSPTSEQGREESETQHEVCVDDFYLGKYEVTQGQWEAVMDVNRSRFKKGDNYPVDKVSWDDAQQFFRKMNKRRGGAQFRLPTEAEWEYACRAGTKTPFHLGSNITASQANYDGNFPYSGGKKGKFRKSTVPVGKFSANAFGLYDMHGNLLEWVQDIYASNAYRQHAHRNPVHEKDGSGPRVLRGGSWNSYGSELRCASRYKEEPSYRIYFLGFRAVAIPPTR